MQHHTSTSTDPGLLASLWIDRVRKHRLVEVIRVVDDERLLMQPLRGAHLRPPRYVESTEHLAGHAYQRVTP